MIVRGELLLHFSNFLKNGPVLGLKFPGWKVAPLRPCQQLSTHTNSHCAKPDTHSQLRENISVTEKSVDSTRSKNSQKTVNK